MATVRIALTMSLDGFIAGPEDGSQHGLGLRGGHHLFDWYFSGMEPLERYPRFKPEGANRAYVERLFGETGAVLTGRRTWDIAKGWGGTHPINAVPIVVVTHRAPANPPQGRSITVFVTDGVRSAVAKAKEFAGEKTVGIAGASLAHQCLQEGLIDELFVTVAPMLLGAGVRLFDDFGDDSIRLGKLEVVDGPGATHLRYRVLR